MNEQGDFHPESPCSTIKGLALLVHVVDRLLGPGGCPWDQKQTHESLKKYLLEESYELFDAIDAGDLNQIREEIGDVLLQAVMHSQMEKLAGNWDIEDVAQTTAEKLIRRHPHVFGTTEVADAEEVLRNWDAIKREEKGTPTSILAGVPRSMPGLSRAHTLSVRAARAGFEWPNEEGVWEKLEEELAELRQATTPENVEEEIGDVLFTIVNLARWRQVDPEAALSKMLDRFSGRFQHMEALAEKPLGELSPERWEELWQLAKSHSSSAKLGS